MSKKKEASQEENQETQDGKAVGKGKFARDFKERHPEATAKEIVEAAAKQGISMTEQTVYQATKGKKGKSSASESNPIASLKTLVDTLGKDAVKDLVDMMK